MRVAELVRAQAPLHLPILLSNGKFHLTSRRRHSPLQSSGARLGHCNQPTMAAKMEHSKEHSQVLVQSNFSPHDVEITGPEAVVAEKKGTDEDQWHMRRMGKLQEMRVWRAQDKGPQMTSAELILCAAKLSFYLNFRLFHDSHGHVGNCVRVRKTQYLLLS